jgi:hypothetical protein
MRLQEVEMKIYNKPNLIKRGSLFSLEQIVYREILQTLSGVVIKLVVYQLTLTATGKCESTK